MVARLMKLAALTAPRANVQIRFLPRILTGKEIQITVVIWQLREKNARLASLSVMQKNIAACDTCVIIGVKGWSVAGINCGACGYTCCEELIKEFNTRKKRITDFSGPNCSVKLTDLGIILGSAVKTAQIHNIDNTVPVPLPSIPACSGMIAASHTRYPFLATGKNIFFDREVAKYPGRDIIHALKIISLCC